MPPELRLAEVHDPIELRRIADLFTAVWGFTDEGAPMPSESLRSLAHADGLINAAYDASGTLLGAAALGRAVPGRCYSYLAAVRPGLTDRGVGFALKQHQRTWALVRGITAMSWTFDPLVARNARFNLTKLGAECTQYEEAFYAEMHDAQNAGEIGDRLVGHWQLDSSRAVAAAAGDVAEVPEPSGAVLGSGPDHAPAAWETGTERWLRVPRDIVALRKSDPSAAPAWRQWAREWFGGTLSGGWVADGVTTTSCYHFTKAATTSRRRNDED